MYDACSLVMPEPRRMPANTCEPNSQRYDFLAAPGKFRLSFNYGTTRSDIHPQIEQVGTFYVTCEDVRNSALPMDPNDANAANPRAPDNDAAVVTDMRDTLIREPGLFHVKNGGITIVCDKFSVIPGCEIPDDLDEWVEENENVSINWSNTNIEIDIIPGDGIINGGHTYYSIMSMIDGIRDTAQVKLEFIQLTDGLEDDERRNLISELAIARNKNRQLTDKSSANYLGYYDNWKNILPEHIRTSMIWKEGDPLSENIMDAETELIPLLWGMEFTESNYHQEYNSEGSTTIKFDKSLHRKWYAEVTDTSDPLEHMLPMLPLILNLRENICNSFHSDDFRGNIETRRLTHVRPERAGPNSEPVETIQFRRTNFANWILKGNVRGRGNEVRNTSVFTKDSFHSVPNTFRDILMANFRSALWYKIDLNSEKKIAGWVVDPFILWSNIKVKLTGALLNEFKQQNVRDDPKAFIRIENLRFIDYLMWGDINFNYQTDYPELICHENKIYKKCVEGEVPELWAQNDNGDDGFILIFDEETDDCQGYITYEQSYLEPPVNED